MIGIKTYKAKLLLTLTSPEGQRFEQRVELVIDADSKEEAEKRVKDLAASVTLDSIAITSIHHVGTKTRAELKHSH
ncbi:hypothetical protein ACMAY5_05295 [Arenicellales bacterium nBUS_48]|jgi:phosphoribosylformylglycinamidine (FGAM) synthase PurS component|tara:strand:- start:458 stop:685 length:228 start_codon:yes stop_codon:yes gene_type:complete